MAISSKQRFAAIGTVGVAALVLAGCAPAPEAGDAPAEGASDFTACMVSDEGGFDDRSFNQLAHTGLENAESELGVKILEAESATPDDYAANLTTMVDQGCSIIVPVGFKLADATAAAAEANPEVDFAIVDVEGLGIPNVLELNYDTAQAAFLAGYAAAAYSKTGTVATYGGAAIPTVTIFMDGFANGVKHYNEVKGKDVKVIGWDVAAQQGSFVDDFTNVSRAKEISTGFLSQGADVILEIDFQGAVQIKKIFTNAISVFILPPSWEELRSRLERRGEDSPEVIELRLKNAAIEVAQVNKFDFVIINELFDRALFDLKAIVHSQRLKFSAQRRARAETFTALHIP